MERREIDAFAFLVPGSTFVSSQFAVRRSRFQVPGSEPRRPSAVSVSAIAPRLFSENPPNHLGIASAPWHRMGAKHYWELTAWQAVRAFKVGIYDLVERGPLANDFKLREQLRESVASAQSHIAEGYGRFDPLDFARFVKMSRASMLECHNHLDDAVDRKRITEETRRDHVVRWEQAMMEIGGLRPSAPRPACSRSWQREA